MFSFVILEGRNGSGDVVDFDCENYRYMYIKHDSSFRSHVSHCRRVFFAHLRTHLAHALWMLVFGDSLEVGDFGEVRGAEFAIVSMLVLSIKLGGAHVRRIPTCFCSVDRFDLG